MAEITLAIGASHTPMLLTEPEHWPGYIFRDSRMTLLDADGRPRSYDELVSQADAGVAAALEPLALRETFEQCDHALDRLAETIHAANLDALVVIGDDQKELFQTQNLPAILVYYGDTIRLKRRLPQPGEPEWWSDALGRYYGSAEETVLPVANRLSLAIIDHLIQAEFDIAVSERLPDGQGEGHAFAFVHSRLMPRDPVPVVPVFLNTYYPPNQPTPARCLKLGRAIRAAVQSWPDTARVGVIGSGGLSHFVVDQELDATVLQALQCKDAEGLATLPTHKLNSGTSEIRNWIAMFGASEHLDCQWVEYVPSYRTAAGTGTGCAFGVWA